MAKPFKLPIKQNALFQKPALIMFAILFVIVGITMVVLSFASGGAPVVRDNVDYWRPRIASCESGGRYNAVNSAGYYGAYQFDVGTWSNYGGYARADLAPPEVQDAKFNETYARRGSQPWASSYYCWSKGTSLRTPRPNIGFVPKLSSYNVTVTGQVRINGVGTAGVGLDTCGNSPSDYKTDSAGNFAFILAARKSFCVKVISGVKGATLAATNNNYEHKEAASYENQVAGVNVYHDLWSLFSPSYRWDRAIDSGYDFSYVK